MHPIQCCHNSVIEKPQNDSCCDSNPLPKSNLTGCEIFSFSGISLDNCGCDHNFSKIEDSIIIQSKIDFSKTIVSLIEFLDRFDNNNFTSNVVSEVPHPDKIPIYITVSSYLI